MRESEDEFTRENVYISAHQTRAERQAAYELRCKRRQKATEAANKQVIKETDGKTRRDVRDKSSTARVTPARGCTAATQQQGGQSSRPSARQPVAVAKTVTTATTINLPVVGFGHASVHSVSAVTASPAMSTNTTDVTAAGHVGSCRFSASALNATVASTSGVSVPQAVQSPPVSIDNSQPSALRTDALSFVPAGSCPCCSQSA